MSVELIGMFVQDVTNSLLIYRLAAGVMFVETLPKNQTGKLLRRELKAQVFKGSFGY